MASGIFFGIIVVIIIGVVLFGRRRSLAERHEPAQTTAPPGDPSPPRALLDEDARPDPPGGVDDSR